MDILIYFNFLINNLENSSIIKFTFFIYTIYKQIYYKFRLLIKYIIIIHYLSIIIL